MALDLVFTVDVQRAIVAGLVLAIESDQGRNAEYLRGAFAMARHQARAFGCNWPTILGDARAELGDGLGSLLDSVKGIEATSSTL